ncbi:MAG: hypothetical protein GY940_36260 [bacterium]|nr:hypothetical protein [bacterium]
MTNGTIQKDIAQDQRDDWKAFFTLDDEVSASIAFPGIDVKPVPVTVLSISEDSIGILGTRCKLPSIHVGDRFSVRDIHAPPPLGTIDQVEVAVKEVVDDGSRVRFSLDCKFLEIRGLHYWKIQDYVKNRMTKMGFGT